MLLRVFPSFGQTSWKETTSTGWATAGWATVTNWTNEVPNTTVDNNFTIAVNLRSNNSL
jgi:hypothetical protein